MTSDIRAHQIDGVLTHDAWTTSADYLAAQRVAERWGLDAELVDALGLNGREPRTTGSARRKD